MNPNKALWEKGDFTRIAESMRESGEALVKELGVTNGLEVLDLGCGDGTTALPAAMLGANVLGVDIARNLVEAGNERARRLGLTNCRFQEGDASDLRGIDDEQIRPRRQHLRRHVRAEALRCGQRDSPGDPARRSDRHGELDPQRPDAGRPDPEDQRRLFPTATRRVHQPDDLGGGGQRNRAIRRRRSSQGEDLFERDTYTFTFPGTPSELLAQFRTYYGPTMNAFEAATADGRDAELQGELEALFKAQNNSPRRMPHQSRPRSCSRQSQCD